jgi:hypothetical protein
MRRPNQIQTSRYGFTLYWLTVIGLTVLMSVLAYLIVREVSKPTLSQPLTATTLLLPNATSVAAQK